MLPTPEGKTSGAISRAEAATLPFLDTTRFQSESRLGAGGMGIVYRVFDRQRGRSVALKMLGRVGPDALYDLKREFRALRNVRHPGLIHLHELFATDAYAYFTMELVDGTPFTSCVDAAARIAPLPRDHASPSVTVPEGPANPASARTAPAGFAPPQYDKLRRCLVKLALALNALHRAGKLHRDIKPSNVLVTREERVVLLDFGLSQDVWHQDPGLSYQERLVGGTPAYMAPEQAAGNPASTASDWYAVGVMLFETLSGKLPFDGSVEEIFSAKQEASAPTPPTGEDVPADLVNLCKRLLERSPSRRPTGAEVLRALGSTTPLEGEPNPPPSIFVGREQHLAQLETAFRKAVTGQPALVTIIGPSGAGKTALVRHFCDRRSAQGEAVVLWSRCHPREAIPFRALDAAIDELSRMLRQDVGGPLGLPRHTGPLTRLFPSLARVHSIQAATETRTRGHSPALERRLAFDALSELLSRVSDRCPLILVIDDAQFGDHDSAELLTWLFSQPAPPGMLVLCCYRGPAENSDLVTALLRARLGSTHSVELELFELPADDANELAQSLLEGAGLAGASPLLAATLASEADGLPGTMIELVADAARHPLPGASSPPFPNATGQHGWLAASRKQKIDSLDRNERALLRLLTLAFSPISLQVIVLASELGAEQCRVSVHALLQKRLIWAFATSDDDVFMAREQLSPPFDEKLAEPVDAQVHSALAASLLQCGDLANAGRHFKAHGDLREAAACFYQATKGALASNTLESALGYIDEALSCGGENAERARLHELQASCHEGLGRPARASDALRAAAAVSTGSAADHLLRRALLLQAQAGEFEALSTNPNSEEVGLFDSLPRSTIESIVSQSMIVHGEPGDRLASSGDDAGDFLFVLSGMIELHQPAKRGGAGALLGQVGTGELVGEVGFLLETQRRVDIVVAAPGTRILRVSRASLDELAVQQPRVALQVVLNLAKIVCGKLVALGERALRPLPGS